MDGWLCLTRCPGQDIRIGDDIVVRVERGKHGKIKVLVKAPRHIPVHRAEVYEEIHAIPNERSST